MRAPSLLLALLLPLSLASPLNERALQSTLPPAPPPLPLDNPTCSCAGTDPRNSSLYVCNDARLGPVTVPTKFPLLGVVRSYRRFGGLTPANFLAKWRDPAAGAWRYPPRGGYLLDTSGNPITSRVTLQPGTILDRFGSEYGKYLAAAEAPYAQRSLPPDNLNTNPAREPGIGKDEEIPWNYYLYKVLVPFEVDAGPVAPAFEQPGLGMQFYVGPRSVKDLVIGRFVERLREDYLPWPGEVGGSCDPKSPDAMERSRQLEVEL